MRLSEVGKSLTAQERADLVRATAGRVPRVAGNRQVGRLIALEPQATSASNTLGVVSIGTGSAGSFNYAGLQRVEAKDQARPRRVAKREVITAVPKVLSPMERYAQSLTKKPRLNPMGRYVRVDRGRPMDQRFWDWQEWNKAKNVSKGLPSSYKNNIPRMVGGKMRSPRIHLARADMDPKLQTAVYRRLDMHREGKRTAKRLAAAKKAGWVDYERNPTSFLQRHIERGQLYTREVPWRKNTSGWVDKADDRFLREHRNRISPDAERGYQYLRRGRNKHAVVGVAREALAGGDAASAYWFARKGHPVLAGAMGTAGLANAVLGARDLRTAGRWNAKMDKIKARAYQRARDGQYGRDRNTDVAKAVLRPRMAYGSRVGGLVRRGSRTFTRRGSIQGSIQPSRRF